MFKSLRIKLLLYFFIINAVVLSVYGVFIYGTAKKGILDTTDTKLRMLSLDVIPDFKNNRYANAREFADELFREFEIDPLFVKIIYYNQDNNSIEYETLSSNEHKDLFNIPLNEIGHLGSIYYFNKDIYRISSMSLFEKNSIKVFIQLATKKELDSPYIKQLLYSLAVATPIILIIFLFIANILINKTLSPVKGVIKAVRSISANNLSKRIETNNIPSEIKELVATFNTLLCNLENSFREITDFSNNASHELKTPLTVIRGEIEVALKYDRDPAQYREILRDILQESISIQKMLEQLLFLAKKETLSLTTDFHELYLDEILTDTSLQLEKFSKTKEINLELREITPLTLYANVTLLKIAIINILRNAIIYSKNHSTITTLMREDKENYIVSIQDQGYGIDKEDLPFLFDRFYRADKSRSRKDAGVGLGLAIVKMILDIHHYDIEIQSTKGVGTTVNIKIPKSEIM